MPQWPSSQETAMEFQIWDLLSILQEFSEILVSQVLEIRRYAKEILHPIMPSNLDGLLSSAPDMVITKGRRKTNFIKRDKSHSELIQVLEIHPYTKKILHLVLPSNPVGSYHRLLTRSLVKADVRLTLRRGTSHIGAHTDYIQIIIQVFQWIRFWVRIWIRVLRRGRLPCAPKKERQKLQQGTQLWDLI